MHIIGSSHAVPLRSLLGSHAVCGRDCGNFPAGEQGEPRSVFTIVTLMHLSLFNQTLKNYMCHSPSTPVPSWSFLISHSSDHRA